MCGVCGIYSPSTLPSAATVCRMMAALHHRGPDGCGWFRDDAVALGHTHLAGSGDADEPGFVATSHDGPTHRDPSGRDPSGREPPCREPLCDEGGQVWVTLDGAIFDDAKLTAQLRDRGHHLRTHCDAELVLHAWLEWGPACFERLDGQWALAIWDRRAGRLVLCRDRLGVHPLYYAHAGAHLLFASEVKALLTDPQVPRAVDPVGLDQTLTLWSPLAPRTVFSGVAQVPPGTYVEVDATGLHEHRYWELGFPAAGTEPRGDLDANAAELRGRLLRASRLRFEHGAGPVGAYLSGGIDSAVTAAAITASTGAPLHTFSLRFADAEYDEGAYQRLVSRRLGTVQHDVVVTPGQIADVFPDVVRHAENVLLRTAPAPMLLLARLARDSGFPVVLTGEGSDEVLAGYDLFREARLRARWAADPTGMDRERAVEQLYPWLRRSPTLAPAFAARFFGRHLDATDPALSHRPRWDATAVLTSMLTPELRVAGPADAAVLERMPAEASGWDPLARAQWLEMTTLLPGYLLASQGDRMLMAGSVAGRFPFLADDVVALACELPAEHKLHGMDEKHVLKLAFADLVPPEVMARPKQPYRAPDAAAFFATGSPPWFDETVSPDSVAAAGLFQPSVVEHLLAKCRRTQGRGLGNTDNMRLVAVVSGQLLHRLFLDHGQPVPAAPPSPMAVFDRATTRSGHP